MFLRMALGSVCEVAAIVDLLVPRDLTILRRIACSAMALFRARTLRADANRLMPWRVLTRKVYAAIMTATEEAVNGLRTRTPP